MEYIKSKKLELDGLRRGKKVKHNKKKQKRSP